MMNESYIASPGYYPKYALRSRAFVIATLLVLIITTAVWASLTANLHQSNADQLVDTYLMANPSSAALPGAHTFLFKLPVLWLQHVNGATAGSFMALTLVFTFITVGALAWLLYKIERRPFVFGCYMLALSSMLLYVPLQPAEGSLLPVNIAMLTTRNLEYVLFIAGIYWAITATRSNAVRYFAAIFALSLLFASDKLFVILAAGSAAITVIAVLWLRARQWYAALRRLVVAIAGSWTASIVVLKIVQAMHVVTIINAGNVSPYTVKASAKAAAYAVSSIATNFGANIAYDKGFNSGFLQTAITRLSQPWNVGYIVNGVLLCLLLFGTACFLRDVIRRRHTGLPTGLLGMVLLGASITACAAFVATDHFYAVDARYVTIIVPALWVCAAVWVSNRYIAIPHSRLLAVIIIIIASNIFGIVTVTKQYHHAHGLQAPVAANNTFIADALMQSNTTLFAADYWRAVPVLSQMNNRHHDLSVVPLSGCTEPRQVLTGTNASRLQSEPFAYLLSLQKGYSDFPECSEPAIIKAYGLPNRSVIVDGTADTPKEVLLFFGTPDSRKEDPKITALNQKKKAFFQPNALSSLPSSEITCNNDTVMNIVAHQDDDLLFMSPDLLTSVEQKKCIRTVYLTAGDAAMSQAYWLGRQIGAQAAYAKMLHIANEWNEKRIKIGENRYVTLVTPRARPDVTLIFMHLPDGNTGGEGFSAHDHQSLHRLVDGTITRLTSVDGLSSYSTSDITSTLKTLLATYTPAEVRTQVPNDRHIGKDHSDHTITGTLVQESFAEYAELHEATISYYQGYSVQSHPENVNGDALAKKIDAFFTYANYDSAVCRELHDCDYKTVYGKYLRRQYKLP